MRSTSIPEDFPFDKVELNLDYDSVRIENASFLMPVHSENLMCTRDSNVCSKNVIDFRNYRKFTAQSDIQYDKKLVSIPSL